jgi:integrase
VRPHWRYSDGVGPGSDATPGAEIVNPGPGKAPDGDRYAAVTVAHCESVLRGFYDFHLENGHPADAQPVPLARARGGTRARAHQRRGRYRPKVVTRVPRAIPDDRFDQLFARLGSHRDRALVAFWVSTGARASELLGPRWPMLIPGSN